jgi:hypothetical protein
VACAQFIRGIGVDAATGPCFDPVPSNERGSAAGRRPVDPHQSGLGPAVTQHENQWLMVNIETSTHIYRVAASRSSTRFASPQCRRAARASRGARRPPTP